MSISAYPHIHGALSVQLYIDISVEKKSDFSHASHKARMVGEFQLNPKNMKTMERPQGHIQQQKPRGSLRQHVKHGTQCNKLYVCTRG